MKLRAFVVALPAAWLGGLAVGATVPVSATNTIYDKNCSVCHQAAGIGVPGAFPRLSGRAGTLAGLDAGRKLMISAVLYGMAGKVQVDNEPIIGVMTPLPQLSDAEIADVLNYIAHLDHKTPKRFTTGEVKAVRAQPPLSPAEVNALARNPILTGAAP